MFKFGVFGKNCWKRNCPIKFGKRRRNFQHSDMPAQIYSVNNPIFDLNTSLPDFNSVYYDPKSSKVAFNHSRTESNLPPPSYDELNLKTSNNQASEKEQN